MIIIIPITKDEAQALNAVYGVNFGDYGISVTRTRYKKFYMTESMRNMRAISEIRNDESRHIIYTPKERELGCSHG